MLTAAARPAPERRHNAVLLERTWSVCRGLQMVNIIGLRKGLVDGRCFSRQLIGNEADSAPAHTSLANWSRPVDSMTLSAISEPAPQNVAGTTLCVYPSCLPENSDPGSKPGQKPDRSQDQPEGCQTPCLSALAASAISGCVLSAGVRLETVIRLAETVWHPHTSTQPEIAETRQ